MITVMTRNISLFFGGGEPYLVSEPLHVAALKVEKIQSLFIKMSGQFNLGYSIDILAK